MVPKVRTEIFLGERGLGAMKTFLVSLFCLGWCLAALGVEHSSDPQNLPTSRTQVKIIRPELEDMVSACTTGRPFPKSIVQIPEPSPVPTLAASSAKTEQARVAEPKSPFGLPSELQCDSRSTGYHVDYKKGKPCLLYTSDAADE